MIPLVKSLFLFIFTYIVLPVTAVSGWMLFFEEDYIFFPEQGIYHTPSDEGLPFKELHITAKDGTIIHGWLITTDKPRYNLLHFHGNAGNISHRLHLYRQWHAMGLNVLAIDYRGYGKSAGKPSENGVYLDAEAAWDYLTKELGIPPSNIIIAGRSLGSAVASRLAIGKKAAGLVLETPFTNIREMAAELYPWLPVRPLIRTKMDTLSYVKQKQVPLLVIATSNDAIVPPAMAKQIYHAATEPKRFLLLKGDHNRFDTGPESPYAWAWKTWLISLGENS